jgi:hypothetical protein
LSALKKQVNQQATRPALPRIRARAAHRRSRASLKELENLQMTAAPRWRSRSMATDPATTLRAALTAILARN